MIKKKIKKFQDNFFPILEVQTTRTNLINGVASSYYGFQMLELLFINANMKMVVITQHYF